MKANKGIIGIGLVLAIVLGIVVVGGGAIYWTGYIKDGGPKVPPGKKEVKNPENVNDSQQIKETTEGNIYTLKLASSIYSIYSQINSKIENRKLYPVNAFTIGQFNTKETCPFVTKINFKLSHQNIVIPINTNFYLTDEDGFSIGKSGKLNNEDIIAIDIPTDGSGMCIPWQWSRTIVLSSDNSIFEPIDDINAPVMPNAKVIEVEVLKDNKKDKISCSKIFLPEGNNSCSRIR